MLGEGIVTMVDPDPEFPSANAAPPIEARLFAVFDGDVDVTGRPAFNDDIVVMVQCSLFLVDERGHPEDYRFVSRYIDRKMRTFKLDSRIYGKSRWKGF